jgi:hypothetical protein
VRRPPLPSNAVEQARKVIDRLRRIEALEREGAPARSVLAEVHELLLEAEDWLAAERVGADLADAAVARCREAYDKGRSPISA